MALNPQYEDIGKGFVQQYYSLFDDPANRASVVNFYSVSSVHGCCPTLFSVLSSSRLNLAVESTYAHYNLHIGINSKLLLLLGAALMTP